MEQFINRHCEVMIYNKAVNATLHDQEGKKNFLLPFDFPVFICISVCVCAKNKKFIIK